MFERLKIFIDFYFLIKGLGDYQDTEFSIEFNYDMVVNESDIITDIKNSVGIVSNKTLLQNHPYVDDVEKEEERLKQEQEESLLAFDDYSSLEENGGGVNEQ